MKPLLLTVSLLLGPLAAVLAQDYPVFPRQRLEELRQEVNYAPPEPEPTPEPVKSEIDWESFRRPLIVALSVFVLAVLGLLTYLILRGLRLRKQPSPDRRGAAIEIGEIVEEELVEHGVDHNLLLRAERAGRYDVAVRLHYISLLKSLHDSGAISYRRDYSNRDYLRQLAGGPLWDGFRTATSTYERYWYGRYRIDRLSYRLAARDFTVLSDRIHGAVTNSTPR